MSALKNEVTEQSATIQRLLKPSAFMAESQMQNMESVNLAEVSVTVDHLTDAVDKAKRGIAQQEIEKARQEEKWKKWDADTQAKVRQEKRIQRLMATRSQERESND